MSKSSFHIQKTDLSFALLHNTRKIKPDYLIDEVERNQYNRTAEEALERYASLLDEALSNYVKRTKQQIQVQDDKLVWEAVVNLTDMHTLKDVLHLTKILEEHYGWQEISVSVHKDEGYIDEITDERIYNYHAHIVFFMLSKQGIYMFKKRDFSRTKMSEIQTLVAHTLNMERGKKSNKVRLNATQYRQVLKEKSSLEIDLLTTTNDFENMVLIALNEQEQKIRLEREIVILKNKIKALENSKDNEAGDEKSVSNTDKIPSLLLEEYQHTPTIKLKNEARRD